MKQAAMQVSGFVEPGFEAVREAFIENFHSRHELGAACAIYYKGKKVVDLWGGIRKKETGEPWEENTMVIVFSTSKGISALTMALANSRGLFNYDDLISRYWPEFSQEGKEKITIRQLLAHQAGLFALDELVDKSVIADLDKLSSVLARQKCAYEPGTRVAYHALTLGFYEGEIFRRVDPKHRTLGEYFQDEIANPLGLDLYIRLPESVPNSRLATIQFPNMARAIFTFPVALTLDSLRPSSNIRRALWASLFAQDSDKVYARNFEVPSGGVVGSARSIARLYSVFATGGHELGIREETLSELKARAVRPKFGFHDECLKVEAEYSLGFTKPNSGNPFGDPSSFGAPGAGGSFGYADPRNEIGYGYVMNQMGTYLMDPRDIALRKAMYRSIGKPDPYQE